MTVFMISQESFFIGCTGNAKGKCPQIHFASFVNFALLLETANIVRIQTYHAQLLEVLTSQRLASPVSCKRDHILWMRPGCSG